jgi:pimeloyl-ACP methyl ester carboxylesterase
MSTYVAFFGGYQATAQDMKAWWASAKAQRPDVTFDCYPWPSGANSDAESAVNAFTRPGDFDLALTLIHAHAGDQIYIVGHSSGCAIANAIDLHLTDTSKVNLVALDGFAPDSKQRARPTTQMWAAECGKAVSRNHDALKRVAGGRLRIYKATDCLQPWALHFSVVNSDAMDRTVTSVATGYAGCRANLVWM